MKKKLAPCLLPSCQLFTLPSFLTLTVAPRQILLVPYHSWRISHRKHHSRTNHMTEDEVFIPQTRSETEVLSLEDKPREFGSGS